DRGITEILIEQGVEASIIASRTHLGADKAQNVADMIADHLNIVDGLFDYVKGGRSLSEHFIRGLHQEFTRNQHTTTAMDALGRLVDIPLLRGEYKKRENNPRRDDGSTHSYCPPELVEDEMQVLTALYEQYETEVAPEVLSAWLHHRFAQIHPFQDGNGRVARTIASLVFLKHGLFPLVVRDRDRTVYIEALESADVGDLRPLSGLFARRQRDQILGALSADPSGQAHGQAQ
ncbi:MAG: Fic family protein, partial [Oligoflexia bacterium]|nr:Fic family protein [Oligoflexia bacterium]